MNVYEKLFSLYADSLRELEANEHKKEFIRNFLIQKGSSNINELLMFYAIGSDYTVDFNYIQSILSENPIDINNIINILNNFLFKKRLDEKNKKLFDIIKEFVPEQSLYAFFQYIAIFTASKSSSNRLIKMMLSKVMRTDISIEDYIKRIQPYFDNDPSMDKLIKLNKRKIQILKELIDAITNFNDKPFYELNKETIAVLDAEGLNLVYSFILNHQERQYKRLTKQLSTPDRSLEDSIEQILNSYQISLNHFSNKSKLLNYANIENLKEILQSMKQAGIDFSLFEGEAFLDIITFANPKDVYYIISLITKNIISFDFIYKNPGIFLNENGENKNLYFIKASFQDIVDKVNIINALNLDYRRNYSDQILFLNKQVLMDNIKLLRIYANSFNNQNLWCALIINPSLFKLIDFFLENGLDFSNINFDNINRETNIDCLIKRLYLASSCNLPIFKNNMIDLTLLAHIEDKDLSEYIPSETEYFIPKDILELLQNNNSMTINEDIGSIDVIKQMFTPKDGIIYFSDNLMISRNKLLRNLSVILSKKDKYSIDNLIFFALIYDSFLSNDEINLIKNQIKKEK